jgi:hypothetical protein
MNDQVLAAAQLYRLRNDWWIAYQESTAWEDAHPDMPKVYPEGHWKNRGSRQGFYPKEELPCCRAVKRSYVYAHCRSAKHIANVFGVERRDVLRVAKALRAMRVLEKL